MVNLTFKQINTGNSQKPPGQQIDGWYMDVVDSSTPAYLQNGLANYRIFPSKNFYMELRGSNDSFVSSDDLIWRFGGSGSNAFFNNEDSLDYAGTDQGSAVGSLVGSVSYDTVDHNAFGEKTTVLDVGSYSLYKLNSVRSKNQFGNDYYWTSLDDKQFKVYDQTGTILIHTFSFEVDNPFVFPASNQVETFDLSALCFGINTIVPEKNILGEFCRVVKFPKFNKDLYLIPKDTFGNNLPDRDFKITAGHPFILDNNGIEVFVENFLNSHPQIKKIENEDKFLATVVTQSRTICKIHGMDVITFSEEEFEQRKKQLGLVVYANL